MAADPSSLTAVLRLGLPWFARNGRAWQVLEPLGRAMDKLVQETLEAVRLRYPGVCPEDALSIHGLCRRIPRAGGESSAAYRRRLLLWLDLWAHAGLPLGLLYAVQSFIFPGYPRVRLVARAGWWYTLDEGASRDLSPWEALTLPCAPLSDGRASPYRYVPAVGASPRAKFWLHLAIPSNWDWDSVSNPERSESWWDYNIIVYPSGYDQQPDVYGSSTGVVLGSNTCWGLDTDQGTIDTLRTLVTMYQRAGAQCSGIILPPSLSDFDPSTPPGDPSFPDGYWGRPAKSDGAGGVTFSRRLDCRYILQFPEQNGNSQ
jgi:hypothetical protein